MDHSNPSPERPDSVFEATRWTLVMRAREESTESQAALSDLCEAYWQPIYQFLRRRGRNDDESRELTQEFFARLLAKGHIGAADPSLGRFRSYLLGALKRFVAEKRRNERRLKRGGEAVIEPLDERGETPGGRQIADPTGEIPDKQFDRGWALAIVDRGLKAVQAEFARTGKADRFEVLKPWLVLDDPDRLSQAQAAATLGLTVGAVKVAIHRLRGAFRDAIEAEVAQTVSNREDLADELSYLVEVLS